MTRVAIVGSRGYPLMDSIDLFVQTLPPDTVVVSGGARGVDREAARAARRHGLSTMVFFADWATYGRRAGMVRNEQIVDHADQIVAFWDGQSPGTADTIRKARRKGLPVRIFRSENTHRAAA
jgi:hypothetical protein